jgi:hypothetical protein
MTPERSRWYSEKQTVSLTPMEATTLLFQATQKMLEHPNNHVAKKYFEEIGPASRDVFIGDLAFCLFNNPPPP